MIRIMTSNIWGDYFGNEVANREDQLFETYVKYAPDILGIQEVTPGWHDSTLMIHMRRAGYRLCNSAPYGVNNFNVLFVKDSRLEVYRQGFEQLACTEDPSKNIQWAVLKDREDGRTIAVCNTHFEYRGGARYDHVREIHAEQIAWRMTFLKDHYQCDAAFGFGDMNSPLSASIFPLYTKYGFTHLSELAPEKPAFASCHGDPIRGEDGRYHGNTTDRPFENSIDHIIGAVGPYRVTSYRYITDQPALDATDHSPVYADLTL